MITDDGLNLIAQSLRDGTSPEITYIALGSGSTAPTNLDHTLVSEQFRKTVTQHIDNGTGDTQTICYIAPFEANDFDIQEIGAFGGAADDTSGSGTLIARWLYSRQKTDLESIQVTRDDIFGRG